MIASALRYVTAIALISMTTFMPSALAADGRVASATPKQTIWDAQWALWRKAAETAGFEFDYYVNGELGGENQIISSVRRNRIQVAGTSSAAMSAVIPEISVTFAPYLFHSAEEADFVYDKYLMPVLRDIALGYGFHLIDWGEVGWSHLYATKPIREPSDVKGMRLRGPVNVAHQAFLRSIGADAVALGLPDIVPSLQTGMITGGMANIVLHTATTATFAKTYTLTGHIYDTNFFFTNLDWYKGLTPEKQKALDGLISNPAAARKEIRAMSDGLIAALKQKPDTTVITLSDETLAHWRNASAAATKDIVAQSGPRAQEVLDAITKGLAAYRAQQTQSAAPGAKP